MRTIERTTQFKRDYKRESKGPHRATLDEDFIAVVKALLADKALGAKYKDHPMSGEWKDCRNCHVRPDLVLLYRKVGMDVLQLVRLGSHSELGI